MEIMLHRNPDMAGDGGPALTDFDVVYPKLRLLLTPTSVPTASPSPVGIVRTQAQWLNFPLTPFSIKVSSVGALTPAQRSYGAKLPANVHLLSFIEWG
jgi:hypothetical protein